MNTKPDHQSAARWLAAAAGLVAGSYAATTGAAWLRFGHVRRSTDEDVLLDLFMPASDIVERHHVRIEAPAETVLDAAREMDRVDAPRGPR